VSTDEMAGGDSSHRKPGRKSKSRFTFSDLENG
jgi:hypothetical protein